MVKGVEHTLSVTTIHTYNTYIENCRFSSLAHLLIVFLLFSFCGSVNILAVNFLLLVVTAYAVQKPFSFVKPHLLVLGLFLAIRVLVYVYILKCFP